MSHIRLSSTSETATSRAILTCGTKWVARRTRLCHSRISATSSACVDSSPTQPLSPPSRGAKSSSSRVRMVMRPSDESTRTMPTSDRRPKNAASTPRALVMKSHLPSLTSRPFSHSSVLLTPFVSVVPTTRRSRALYSWSGRIRRRLRSFWRSTQHLNGKITLC